MPHTTLAGGGHFLQEDVGPELGRVVAAFVAATPRS
jgi:haloalkane dehalogenase